jgi:hypothetical protein
MATLNLQGELGRRLTIEVHGYESDAPQDPYDANWMRCSTEAEVGRFRGAVDASFTTQDFARFLAELDQIVKGTSLVASFQTMEAALSVRVEVDRAGRAIISGKLREIDVSGSTLSFAFESNLSFLGRTQAELKRVVSEFPERTAIASPS